MQIKRSIEKIPGGMMLVPLFLGALCHTFSPGAGKYFGSFTNGMITGTVPILAVWFFCMGASIKLSATGTVLRKSGTLVVTKIAVAWVVAAIASRIIPEHGVEVGFFAGLSTLALVAAMDMTNGGLYASIMQQYGTKEEAGAFVLMSLESGPLMTMIILGTAGIVTRAGQLKERKMGIKAEEFNLKKGLVLAVMCGIFSAGMSFAINAAKPMHEAAAALGVDPLYVALPSYVIIMGGGAIINLGFCFIRLAKVKDLSLKADFSLAKPLITHNVLLSALGGLMWYLQFFFYAWGHARIPAQYDYISWMLHMSFYVLCGGIVGLVLKEWNNAGRRPVTVLSLGCVVIIVAANIVGIGMAN